jgi:hypothetical protein
MPHNFGVDPSALLNQAQSAGSSSGMPSTSTIDSAASSAGLPAGAGEAVSLIESMVPANDQKYVAQGQALFTAADKASQGDYSGLAAAAEGIVNDFPPGVVRAAVDDVLNVASDASKGAAMGAILGPYGTVVGAVIGAIVGIVEDIFGSTPPTPQGEFRGSAQQAVFPAVPKGTGFSVVPGADNRNPRDEPDSIFYTTDGVPLTPGGPLNTDGNIGEDFTFAVTWVHPPKSTAASQMNAWLLAQVYFGTDDVSLAHAMRVGSASDLAARRQRVELARQMLGTSLGGDTLVTAALKRFEGWYGGRRGWPTQLAADVQKAGNITFPGNQPAKMAFFQKYIVDYLYYPQYASWNGSTYSFSDPKNATDVYLTVDPTALMVAEGAVLGMSNLGMMHMILGKMWLWNRFMKQDAITNPLIDTSHHRNFLRILGLISEKVRNDLRLQKATRAGKIAHQKRMAEYVRREKIRVANGTSKIRPVESSGELNPWIVGGGVAAAGVGGLWLFKAGWLATRVGTSKKR